MVIVTSLPPQQSQPDGSRESSVTTIPPDTRPNRSRDPGLIVGLVFLFLVLIIIASIVIILLMIIILRKKREEKIKSKLTSLASSIVHIVPLIINFLLNTFKGTQDIGMFRKTLWHSQHLLKVIQFSTC